MILLHGATIFVGAFLLFVVEPMVSKMALPWFGGGASVWNVCLLFFQTLLLAGYAYSHYSVRWLGLKRQLRLHALVLLVPLAALPPLIGAAAAPPPGSWPVPRLLGALTVAIGAPFFVLATSSSLVQRWYAARAGRTPYGLYAVSNAGSFLALLAYPLLIEPRLGLAAEGRLFAWGYGAFLALTAATMWGSWRAPAVAETEPPAPRFTLSRRAGWLFRAMVPSLLLLAISLKISIEVAAMPLLWIVPLAIYLLTFIVAFAERIPRPGRVAELLCAVLVAMALGWGPLAAATPLWFKFFLPLAALAIGCWICHADLASDRPPPEGLTEFYLWISLGGFAGGVLGNLVAPIAFHTIAEYPITLMLLVVCLVARRGRVRDSLGDRTALLAILASAVVLGGWAFRIAHGPPVAGIGYYLAPLFLLGIGVLAWRWLPGVYFGIACVVGGLSMSGMLTGERVLAVGRSFYGPLRVTQGRTTRRLVHGTTFHGAQQTDPLRHAPMAYYHPRTPMGQAVLLQPPDARIAVIGLGTGSIAALTQHAQRLTYYEIDPLVEPLARRWFTYLGEAIAPTEVRLGDARLEVARAPAASYELLVVDAFSSDAIPVHLLTHEAVALYLEKMAPDGVILFHITNRYVNLEPVVRAHARAFGLVARIDRFDPTPGETEDGAWASDAVVVARSEEALARFDREDWPLLGPGREISWTDDRSSLLDVFVPVRELLGDD